jgi:hypothetical protein
MKIHQVTVVMFVEPLAHKEHKCHRTENICTRSLISGYLKKKKVPERTH